MPVEKPSSCSVSFNRETAAAIIAELRKNYGDKASLLTEANEAKTRLLVIDRILECLGWSKDDFNPEYPIKHVGFTDYLISADDIPRFIVEAKRVGKTFARPQTGLKKTGYQLSYIRSSFGPAVSEVIDQAVAYAKEIGISYSVITNGAEWMLIQAIPFRNININDSQCIYFGNLLSNSSHFDFFWDLLAKNCVLEGRIEEYFSELNSLPSDFCQVPSSKLSEISWSLSTETEKKYIREFYDLFFDEIIDPGRRMMLEQCFVSNPKLDQYQGELKRTLQDVAPIYIPKADEISPDYNPPTFLSTESGDRKGRVVLITGSVGCGKSTLVNKVLIETSQADKKKFNYLIIDLINEYDGTQESINDDLLKKITEKWKKHRPEAYEHEALRKIFGRELQELRKGPYARVFDQDPILLAQKEAEKLEELSNSPSQFLEKSWRYYANQSKKDVVVFLDNIDRTSDLYQRVVYRFAHQLASQTGATVIITMREGTYFRGQESDFLDVRSDDIVYHLQAPDLVQVLSKRIEYVENLEQPKDPEKKDHRLASWRSQPDWEEFYQAALKYAKVIKSTFLTADTANQAITLLAAVSWHNVRYFLGVLQELHLMLGTELEIWSTSYIIVSLLMPNSLSRNRSILPILYYPVYASYPCYFLKIRLLLMLLYGRHISELRRGISLKSILSFTRMYSYHERWTRLAVRDMVRERLLECMEIPVETDFTKNYELEESHYFRASPLAVVMLKYVYCNSIYLTMVGRELPFHQINSFENFVKAVQDIINILSEESLNKDGIDLLLETKSDSIVARYLVERFEEEQPIVNIATYYFPEVSTTEEKIKNIISQLLKVAGVSVPDQMAEKNNRVFSIKTQDKDSQPLQLSLVFENFHDPEMPQETNSVRVPNELTNAHIDRKGLAPKIFWSLVEWRARGKKQVTGSEIAQMINRYLLDDLTKVEQTNISKALRGKALQTQSWLRTEQTAQRKKLYGLSDCWHTYWIEFFKEEPPPID
jgi:predicted type IV restriction endonuclease/energy-coupling factor transporter ATP-binding protein EcfA2